jgi:DNA invertase Pin-like site-specific DNA recombinase
MADLLSHSHRVALYARVSTVNHGQDVTLQLSELREYCIRRGFQVAEEYVDAGVSGSKESRPALNRLMADAHRRSFDAVICWKLDRFGRSLKHLVNALAELEALHVAFVSLRDNLDLSTPAGRLMFHIIGAMAQFEKALCQERVKAGLAHARTRGRRLGRPPAKLDLELINSRRAAGASWRAISREFGVHATTALRAVARCAENPSGMGVANA